MTFQEKVDGWPVQDRSYLWVDETSGEAQEPSTLGAYDSDETDDEDAWVTPEPILSDMDAARIDFVVNTPSFSWLLKAVNSRSTLDYNTTDALYSVRRSASTFLKQYKGSRALHAQEARIRMVWTRACLSVNKHMEGPDRSSPASRLLELPRRHSFSPVGTICFVRRIWAHKISFFVPRPRDVAHPGSGPAQDWLRICSGLITLKTIPEGYASRASPELVLYKNSLIGPVFQNQMVPPPPSLYLTISFLYLTVYTLTSVVQYLELITTANCINSVTISLSWGGWDTCGSCDVWPVRSEFSSAGAFWRF